MDKLLTSINGQAGKIMLEHVCFGREVFRCDRIQVVSDAYRLGVRINGHDTYVDKNNVKLFKMYDNLFVIADDFLQITIIVNK